MVDKSRLIRHHAIHLRGRCQGFTLIELLVVMGVIALLSAMAVPTVVSSINRSAIRSPAIEILARWQEARALALMRQPDVAGNHYGIEIRSTVDGRATVNLIFDRLAANPVIFADQRTYTFPDSARLATAALSSGSPSVNEESLIIYAQYGTGLPIAAADVAAGRGNSAAAIGLGIPSPFGLGVLRGIVQVQPRGHAGVEDSRSIFRVAIYPSGVGSVEEVR